MEILKAQRVKKRGWLSHISKHIIKRQRFSLMMALERRTECLVFEWEGGGGGLDPLCHSLNQNKIHMDEKCEDRSFILDMYITSTPDTSWEYM